MQKAFRGVNWPLFSGFYHNFWRSNSAKSCGIFESILCGSLIELMPLFASKSGQNCASFWRGYEPYRYIFLTLRSVKMTLESASILYEIMIDSCFSMDVSCHIFCFNIIVMLKQKSYEFCTDIGSISARYLLARSRKTLRDFQLNLRLLEGKIAAISSGFSCPNLRNFDAKDDAKLSSDLMGERSENDPN